MSGIFGLLGLDDNDRSFVNVIGQELVFDAANRYYTRVNADMIRASALFIQTVTETFKERFKSPGGGRLQRRGSQAQAGAVKATGEWDTAYPLEDFGAQLVGDDVSLAYMRIDEFNNHVQTITNQGQNTLRWEILHAILDDGGGSARTFVDPIHGSLSVQPLANGDSVTYPPVLGNESEATDDHYNESGYAATAITDTNNPYITLREEVEEHTGTSTGGENFAVLINQAETPETEDLTDFEPVIDRFIRAGDDTNVPINLPNVPGRIIGRTNGVWVVEWRWMPANYMFITHLEEPAPLKMRVDPADTGLPQGLTLIATDENYPLQAAHYRWRFGLGAGNRLNGAVMELGTGGSYTIPTTYD